MEELQDVVNKVANEGVPVGVRMDGDLRQELSYGNHRSVEKYRGGKMPRKVMADVGMDRDMGFEMEDAERIRGLRISLVGVVEAKEKSRCPRFDVR